MFLSGISLPKALPRAALALLAFCLLVNPLPLKLAEAVFVSQVISNGPGGATAMEVLHDKTRDLNCAPPWDCETSAVFGFPLHLN